MAPWIDPDETKASTWRGVDPSEAATRTVYERAHETTLPYERRDDLNVAGPDVEDEFQTVGYDHAKLHYRIGVDVNGRVKILSKGHLWGDDDVHQRFRIQYRRAAEPTDVPPFEEYTAWARFQRGTVHRENGALRFDPDPSQTSEKTLTLRWPEMYSSDQLRIAEAELVRNPPLARYALVAQDLWEDVRDALRYNPEAFDAPP